MHFNFRYIINTMIKCTTIIWNPKQIYFFKKVISEDSEMLNILEESLYLQLKAAGRVPAAEDQVAVPGFH